MIGIGVGSRWIILYLIGVHFYCSPSLVMIQECKVAFGLIKGENESCFWFVNKGNLERKPCVWLMLIGKKLEG